MTDINTGDTAWMLISAALVLLMTPGLAFFYGGLTRAQSVLNTMMMSVVSIGLVAILWTLAGYTIAFGEGGNAFLGGLGHLGLGGLSGQLTGTIPSYVFAAFQAMFAIIAVALISGAVVERMRFGAFVLFGALWSLFIYAPLAHWVWNADGWLFKDGALDFAGGTVIHISAGISALVAAFVLGPRIGYPRSAHVPHNVPLVLLGAGLLWFGWMGFNAGSALAANQTAALALITTLIAPAAAMLTWLLWESSGNGKPTDGVLRPDGFDITVASEVMAVFCLARDLADLKERLGNMLVAYAKDGSPVFARDLNAQGAMAALLKDALKPNLVQTIGGTPAFVHGGPFANIAHGCNSVTATRLAKHLADYAVTEAGFGADLGAEKFCDIKCRLAGLKPDAAVVVATVRALKYNGGVAKEDLGKENVEALKQGLPNLLRHIANLKNVFGLPVVVAINRFVSDTDAELALIQTACAEHGVEVSLTEVWGKGGEGGADLARKVVSAIENQPNNFAYAYDVNDSIPDKLRAIAQKIYGAADVDFSAEARAEIASLEKLGLDKLPVCVAKTQYSFSDNAKLLGCPSGFTITVRSLTLSAGAGFIVAVCGSIMKMPGLPKVPSAEKIDVDENGNITGLF